MQQVKQLQCPLKTLKQRAFLMAKIREFFNQRNVLEVETPILSSAGNTDINIESFTAQPICSDFPMSYLRTSPEFFLKRLLCKEVGDIFEIGKVFRKAEVSQTHNVEFTMLEWYRVGFKYIDLIREVKELFSYLLNHFNQETPKSKVITFTDCFEQYLSIHPIDSDLSFLNETCNNNGYSGSHLNRNEALDFLFATQIQSKLDKDKLIFITDYPSSQAALAEINSSDTDTCLRFEVFYAGHELGNAYQELTDAKELRERFEKDNIQRKENGYDQVRIDDNLISAMQNMPKCSGIAMGIDRLLMVLLNCASINEVMPFIANNS